MLDKILKVIESSDLSRNKVIRATITRLFKSNKLEQEFIHSLEKCIYGEPNVYEYFKLDERFVIVKIKNTWKSIEAEFEYKTVDLDRTDTLINVSHDLETQILATLEYKYLDLNSQFTEFACKMLGKPIK